MLHAPADDRTAALGTIYASAIHEISTSNGPCQPETKMRLRATVLSMPNRAALVGLRPSELK